MLHDLRTAPTEARRFDNDDRLTEYSPRAVAAYALAMKADGVTIKRPRFSMFDKNDRSMFFASAVMVLLPLIGGYFFDR